MAYNYYHEIIVAGSCIGGNRSPLFDLIRFSIIDLVPLMCRFMYGKKFTNKSTAFNRRDSDDALDGKNVKERYPTAGGMMLLLLMCVASDDDDDDDDDDDSIL